MSHAPLTRRQRQILDFYRAYHAENGMSPTLEEIAERFGVNKVTVFGHVAELERKGVLKRSAPGVSRGLQIVEQEGGTPPASLPILGNIAAGSPIEAIEVSETFDLGELIPPGREVYALRVQGDSMIEDAIADGDIVVVERRSHAQDGETVVAVLPDGEATLKRFYREDDNTFRLQPANAAMEPIRVPDVEVRGVVIGVVRRY